MRIAQGCGVAGHRAGDMPARTAAIIGLSLVMLLPVPAPVAAGLFSVYGPRTLVRAPGPPVAVSIPFQVANPAAGYTLRIRTGGFEDSAEARITSAAFRLNGITVIGPQEFNPRIDVIERPVDLDPANELVVELHGEPGAALTFEVWGSDDDAPVITADVAPPPGPAGWHREDATVTFTCADATSGIAVCPGAVTVTEEGAAQVVSGTAWDRAGNGATASVVIRLDKTPPLISATPQPAANASGWHDGDVTVTFACSDALSGIGSCSAPVTLTEEGAGQRAAGLAADLAGNTAAAGVTVHIDKTAPAVSFLEPADGATVSGVLHAGVAAGDASGIDRVEFTLDGAGIASDAGARYGVTIDTTQLGDGPHIIGVTAFDAAGNGGSALVSVIVANGPPLPPDPADVAPPLENAVAPSVHTASAFLYTGVDPIQTGVAPGAIEARRAAVVRGRIADRDGHPLPGVAVSVHRHPEFGATLSRADGVFDLAVNGGGPLTVDYQKPGYLPVQRRVDVPWQDYASIPDVVMVGLDPQVTAIDLSKIGAVQVARGSIVTDEDGSRRAALLFPPGTTALMRLPDGSARALSTLHVRATEYTVGASGPAAMPGELPPASAYTYAVEFSVDEALTAGAAAVEFSQPVINYLENFLDIPVGWEVPTAYYDRNKTAWIPAPNGRVVRIVEIDAEGLAHLDLDGAGAAADPQALSEIGITAAERRTLGGLYAAGQTLWRVPIPRFSPWDHNYAYGLSPTAITPNAPPPRVEDSVEAPDCQQGSIIECQNQVLGERLPVAGTPHRLVYRSDGVPGRTSSREIKIPLTPATVPYSLQEVTLDIRIAGRRFYQVFPPLPDQTYIFKWDGRDGYGREVRGGYVATIEIGYGYRPIYLPVPRLRAAFGAAGVPVVDVAPRYRSTTVFTLRRRYQVKAASRDERARGLGGWTLDPVHAYDFAQRTLYLGDGSRREADTLGRVIDTAAGDGHYGLGGDGGPALRASLRGPTDVAVGPDGTLYIADTLNNRIRRVRHDGTTTTIAGGGAALGDGGPATQALLSGPSGIAVGPEGTVVFADTGHGRIRGITPGGTITTLAGNGGYGFSGDGGPATQATLASPRGVALGRDGTLYIADTENHRIRRVGPDGAIHTMAGGEMPGFGGDGGSAYGAYLYLPYAVAQGHDGSVYVADTGNGRVRRVAPDGTIDTVANANAMDIAIGRDGAVYLVETERYRVVRVDAGAALTPVAGSGAWGYCGDGGLATQGCLNLPRGAAVGQDGTLYIADTDNNRIRRVYFPLPGYDGAEFTIASADGGELYRFDAAGRHRATLDALSGAVRREYVYDGAGYLSAARDADGNVVTIERYPSGAPGAIVAPDGQRTHLTLDDGGYLSGASNPQGEAYRFSYTADGLLLSATDPNGNTSQMSYDARGRLARDRNAAGGYTELGRTDLGDGDYLVETTSAEGRVAAYRVTRLATGEARTKRAPDGTVVETAIDQAAGTRSVVQADGTGFHYALGPDPRFGMLAPMPRTAIVTTPGGVRMETERVRSVEHDPIDPAVLVSQTEEVRVNGLSVGFSTFIAADNKIVSSGVDGMRTLYLDDRGHVTRELAAFREPVSYGYDGRGRLSALTQGARTVGFAYDGAGNLAVATDPLGRSTRFEYDRAGRVVRETRPDGRAVEYSYDANGNTTSITPPGRGAHVFSYDAIDQKEAYAPPYAGAGTGATRYSYDRDRQLTRVVRPDGGTVAFNYDAGGRLASLALPRGVTEYSYHEETGQLVRLAAPGGAVVSYAYDGLLPVSESWAGEVNGSVTRTYGNLLRPITLSVAGAPVNYQYDRYGRVTQAGTLSIVYGVGDQVSATSMGGWGGGGYCDTELPGCDPRRNPPPGAAPLATAQTYNGFGELESFSAGHGGTPLLSTQYSRDALGRITRKVEAVLGTTTTHDYVYDMAGRLAEVREDGTPTARYEYDGNGNRTGGVTGRGAIGAVYDAQDRLLRYNGAEYGYTDNGELRTRTMSGAATTYGYDALGNLREVSLPGDIAIEYVIDGRDRRVGKKINGELVQGFLYQDQLNPIAEMDGAGNVVARFVYGSKGNSPDYMVRGGVTYRIISDHLGSPRLVVDIASGAVAQRMDYDEFGNVTRDTNPGFQPFGFAGGIYDLHTGLVRFGARDYDPEIGRWTAKDPIGFDGGDANLYGYVLNNPINLFDQNGLDFLSLNVGVGFGPGVSIGVKLDLANGDVYLATGVGVGVGFSATASYSAADKISEGYSWNFSASGGTGNLGGRLSASWSATDYQSSGNNKFSLSLSGGYGIGRNLSAAFVRTRKAGTLGTGLASWISSLVAGERSFPLAPDCGY